MDKIWQVILIVSGVTALYLLMLVIMPIVTDLAATANATMNASSNMSLYPGASAGLISAPWGLWFVPAVIGMIMIVVVLRQP